AALSCSSPYAALGWVPGKVSPQAPTTGTRLAALCTITLLEGTLASGSWYSLRRPENVMASCNICNSASLPWSAPYCLHTTHRCQRQGWVNATTVAVTLTGP